MNKKLVPLRDSIEVGDARTCDGRLWMNIYPDDMDPSSQETLRTIRQCSVITRDIAKVICPHEQFALCARDTLRQKVQEPTPICKTTPDISKYN